MKIHKDKTVEKKLTKLVSSFPVKRGFSQGDILLCRLAKDFKFSENKLFDNPEARSIRVKESCFICNSRVVMSKAAYLKLKAARGIGIHIHICCPKCGIKLFTPKQPEWLFKPVN